MDTIATLVLAFLGSGAVATVITFYLTTRKDELFFTRRKTEELYLAFKRFDLELVGHFMRAYQPMKSEITWDEFHDGAAKGFDKDDAEAFRQVMMLIDLYFPEVKKEFTRYYDQRGALIQIMHEHQRERMGVNKTELYERFHKETGQLISLSKAVEEAIIAEAQKVTNRVYLWPWKGR